MLIENVIAQSTALATEILVEAGPVILKANLLLQRIIRGTIPKFSIAITDKEDLATKFISKRLLGEGGQGQVYLIQSVVTGQFFARKTYRDKAIKRKLGDNWMVPIQEEIRISCQLKHHNIIQVIRAEEGPH